MSCTEIPGKFGILHVMEALQRLELPHDFETDQVSCECSGLSKKGIGPYLLETSVRGR